MKIALKGVFAGHPGSKSSTSPYYYEQPIVIGNIWIGPNCTIFPGVEIEDNVVVMPNTLVKSGVVKFSLVYGNGNIDANSSFVKSLAR